MKWGIIGAGRIAHRFCESLKNIDDCELYAVACRTKEKAQAFQAQHPCKKAYCSFYDIVEDPEIDAVYIATPHNHHFDWIIACLEAHKAVLCEKPACMNVKEIRAVIECAKENKTLFMEAMKTRFIPIYKEVKQRIHNGEIGDITSITVSLCNDVPKEAIFNSYLGDPTSGGVLKDTGIYPISWIEDYLKDDHYQLEHLYTNIQNDVIYYTKALMKFNNVDVTIECAMDRSKPRQTIIYGTKGKIVVDDMHRPQHATINDVELEIPYEVDDFYGELLHFVSLYNNHQKESSIMPLSSSLRCAEIMYTIIEGLDYNFETVELLDKQEKDLTFNVFTDEDFKKLCETLKYDQSNYERNAAFRIYDEETDEVVFEYLPEDKTERNFMFCEGKRNLTKKTGHSSFNAYVKNIVLDEYDTFIHDFPTYCASGGAFPIYADDKHKYTITTSGLHEGEDHELVVNALYKLKGKKIPSFPYRLF